MGADFDWLIDDADGPPEPRPLRPQRRPPRPGWLLLGALVLLAAALAFAWGTRRSRDLAGAQRDAVLQLARVEDDLLRRGDTEALATLQDPNYPGWRIWQAAVARNAVGPGAAFVPIGPSRFGPVELDGEQAWLDVTRRYAAATSRDDPPPEFTLRLRQYYRLANGGWRRSGPPGDALASPAGYEGAALQVSYPGSDATALAPLMAQLDLLAARACAELLCEGPAQLLLSADPQMLNNPNKSGPLAIAPAPALLGAPADAAAAEQLARLYGAALVRTLARRTAAQRGEPAGPWVDWELARLGLARPAPRAALVDTARQALARGVSPLYQARSAPESTMLALEFLTEHTGTNPLPELLALDERGSLFLQLLRRTNGEPQAWWDYLERVAALERVSASNAELGLICSGQVKLWSAATRALRPLSEAGATSVLWSPDGARLAARFALGEAVVVTPGSDEPPVRGAGRPLAWAPDGIALALQEGDGRSIWSPVLSASAPRVTLAPGAGWAGWSPDGEALAYVASARGARPTLYLAGPNGEEPRALDWANMAAWSADGGYLAYADNSRLGAPVQVYARDAQTATEVYSATAGVRYDLAWALDRSLLAIASYARDASGSHGEVVVVDVTGRVRGAWTMAGLPYELQWTPRGEPSWALLPDGGGNSVIWVASPATGDVRVVEGLSGWDVTLDWDWSPDGAWVALDDGALTVRSSDGPAELSLPAGCHSPQWRPGR